MNIKNISISVLLLMVLVFTSCTKSKEEKLQGQWERYNTSLNPFVVDTMQQEMWYFDNGNLKIYSREASGALKLNADLEYAMQVQKGRVAVVIQAKNSEDNNNPQLINAYLGSARIYQLTDTTLAMKGIETLIYYEFYRNK
ncbi:MAG: hypothetical protein K6F29_10195 [Bacteroidales bacterium]|nr:hypothetical protein [Bacteroidales bacterium]MBQ4478731.1 hypothetical protein [Bacteroidales bacterium]MCR5555888.1 hypothetical protein [Bacteroidales bacterium]